MKIEYQVTGLNMARFSFYFSEEHQHENDKPIRDYLEENQLIPKRYIRVERGGERFQVLHFGQCYLGYHLDNIADMSETEPVEIA